MSGEHYKPVEWFVNLSPAAGSTGSKFGLAVEEAIGLVHMRNKSKVSQEFIAREWPYKIQLDPKIKKPSYSVQYPETICAKNWTNEVQYCSLINSECYCIKRTEI